MANCKAINTHNCGQNIVDQLRDIAHLQIPLKLNDTVEKFLKALEDGTNEVKFLLTKECDLLLECKVCKQIYRSFINFIEHKRYYCTDIYDSHLHYLSNFINNSYFKNENKTKLNDNNDNKKTSDNSNNIKKTNKVNNKTPTASQPQKSQPSSSTTSTSQKIINSLVDENSSNSNDSNSNNEIESTKAQNSNNKNVQKKLQKEASALIDSQKNTIIGESNSLTLRNRSLNKNIAQKQQQQEQQYTSNVKEKKLKTKRQNTENTECNKRKKIEDDDENLDDEEIESDAKSTKANNDNQSTKSSVSSISSSTSGVISANSSNNSLNSINDKLKPKGDDEIKENLEKPSSSSSTNSIKNIDTERSYNDSPNCVDDPIISSNIPTSSITVNSQVQDLQENNKKQQEAIETIKTTEITKPENEYESTSVHDNETGNRCESFIVIDDDDDDDDDNNNNNNLVNGINSINNNENLIKDLVNENDTASDFDNSDQKYVQIQVSNQNINDENRLNQTSADADEENNLNNDDQNDSDNDIFLIENDPIPNEPNNLNERNSHRRKINLRNFQNTTTLQITQQQQQLQQQQQHIIAIPSTVLTNQSAPLLYQSYIQRKRTSSQTAIYTQNINNTNSLNNSFNNQQNYRVFPATSISTSSTLISNHQFIAPTNLQNFNDFQHNRRSNHFNQQQQQQHQQEPEFRPLYYVPNYITNNPNRNNTNNNNNNNNNSNNNSTNNNTQSAAGSAFKAYSNMNNNII